MGKAGRPRGPSVQEAGRLLCTPAPTAGDHSPSESQEGDHSPRLILIHFPLGIRSQGGPRHLLPPACNDPHLVYPWSSVLARGAEAVAQQARCGPLPLAFPLFLAQSLLDGFDGFTEVELRFSELYTFTICVATPGDQHGGGRHPVCPVGLGVPWKQSVCSGGHSVGRAGKGTCTLGAGSWNRA